MKIYLSSTFYESDTEHGWWRTRFKSFFVKKNVFFIEPEFQRKPDISVVVQDKRNIDKCSILVAYMAVKTCGTTMEIMYAAQKNLNVYVIDPNGIVSDDPWIRYHSQIIFPTLNVCVYHILEQHIE